MSDLPSFDGTAAIPDELRRSVEASGPAETRWVGELPAAVERLCDA